MLPVENDVEEEESCLHIDLVPQKSLKAMLSPFCHRQMLTFKLLLNSCLGQDHRLLLNVLVSYRMSNTWKTSIQYVIYLVL